MISFRIFIFLLIFSFKPLCFGQLTVISTGNLFYEIPLIQASRTKIEGQSIPLFPIGHTVYTKHSFNVYVVELLASQQKSKNFLNLNNKEAIAIRMTFLRPVNKKSIYTFMTKALQNNGVDLNREEIKNYLKAIHVFVEKGDSFIVLGKKLSDDNELIEVQIPDSHTLFTMLGQGLIRDIFSVWLADVSHDSSLAKVQKHFFD